jgi:hypothetical protein
MTEDQRQQAAILVGLYQKEAATFAAEVLRIARHKAEHGTLPEDTRETFDGLRTRLLAILEAMRKLREETNAEELAPFANVEVPDYFPEGGL